MKRNIWIIALVTTFVLSGCGNTTKDSEAAEAAELQSQLEEMQNELQTLNSQLDELKDTTADEENKVLSEAATEATSEEIVEVGDDIDKAFAKIKDFNFELYNDGESSATITGIETNKDFIFFNMLVKNNNSDNKKVSGMVHEVSINGLRFSTQKRTFVEDLMSGETLESQVAVDKRDFKDLAKSAGYSDISEFPVEQIGFLYSFDFGLDAYARYMETTYVEGNTSLYNESSIAELYGEKVGTIIYDGHELIEYVKQNDGSAVTIFLFNENDEFIFDSDLYINGHYIGQFSYGTDVTANGNYHASINIILKPRNGFAFTIYDDTDTIRKKLEIPNDVPLEVTLEDEVSIYTF